MQDAARADVTVSDGPSGMEIQPAAPASCQRIVEAANTFIGALDPGKKAAAVMAFADRKHYRFTPEPNRPGLSLQKMNGAEQAAALALLKASLSDGGYQKAMTIRTLDDWLATNVGGLPFGSALYHVAVYGTPSLEGRWAWHWEGHHASLHFTFAGCTRAASSPAMFGSEPARLAAPFKGVPAGTRVLGKQEDLGRALATMLAASPEKRALAIVASARRGLPNTPDKLTPLTPAGVPVSRMSPAEADLVKQLLMELAGNMNDDLAAARLARVQEAGFDAITFLWAGALQGDGVYYFRLQGPTFLFEHNLEWENHVHSAWRDFDGDFGEDLLRKHLEEVPHDNLPRAPEASEVGAR